MSQSKKKTVTAENVCIISIPRGSPPQKWHGCRKGEIVESAREPESAEFSRVVYVCFQGWGREAQIFICCRFAKPERNVWRCSIADLERVAAGVIFAAD